MSNRRRVGVSAATTEAARRQLMQPVTCWEKVWITPTPEATAGTAVNLKVYKWVKTEKVPHFSDDENEADEPLAPLPDEVEVIDGDEDMEADDAAVPTEAPEATNANTPVTVEAPPLNVESEQINEEDLEKPATPPMEPELHLAAVDDGAEDEVVDDIGTLDDTLKAIEGETAAEMELGNGLVDQDTLDTMDLSMAALGPDGLPLESSHDLTQMEGPTDAIMGGPMMDSSEDPFVGLAETAAPPTPAQDAS